MTDNKQKRILVVEDKGTIREQYIMALELEDFTVDSAANLQEALDLIEAKTFHVALVDLTLSDPNDSRYEGLDVLKKLKDLDEGTRAIVISDQDSTGTAADTISEYGAVKYIPKSTLVDKGTGYLIKEVSQLAEGVTFKKYTDISYLLLVLAGPGRNAVIWADPLLRILKPKGAAKGLNEFLPKFCKPLVPLISQPDVSPSLALKVEHQFASGKFWSKGFGLPIELVICRADEAAEIRKHESHPGWQSPPLIEYEDQGLTGYAFRLPKGVTRSEFVATAPTPNKK